MKWLVEEGYQHLNESAVEHILMSVFKGLNVHGEHDANLTALLNLGLHIYEMMNPFFPCLSNVLCKLPGVTTRLVENFHKFINVQNSKMKQSKLNKQKKEAFRDVVSGVSGRNQMSYICFTHIINGHQNAQSKKLNIWCFFSFYSI